MKVRNKRKQQELKLVEVKKPFIGLTVRTYM
jgi:hypothetical protein